MARAGGLPLPTITDDRAIGEAVIQRSLRFRRGGSTYLSRTPASQGDRRKFTISWWMKISQVTSSTNTIFSAQRSTLNPDFQINLYEHALIIMGNKDGSSSSYMVSLVTERLFRDPNNWYHCVVAFDTNDSTSSNRVKIYVNGDQVTDFAAGGTGLAHDTYPSSGDQTSWGTNEATQNIGRRYDGDKYFDGYLAEINYVDGSQLTADSFGFTDDQTGVWMPKRYEGGYGNVDNGFRLDFLDNSSTAALGIDKSPNGNDFAVSNHSVSASLTNDSMLDTPTNNFCILDHLNKTNSFTGKDGGLTFDQNSNDHAITGSFFVTSGKWYWEFYKNSGHNPEIGISVVGRETLNNRSTGFIEGRLAFISNGGNLRTGSSSTTSITGSSSGQTGAGWLRVACDMDNKKIWFSDLSGNYFNSGNPATGANPAYDFSSHEVATGWAPYICMTTANDGNGYPNFGQFDLNSFSSNIPAGFKTLTAKNLRDELLTSSGQSINPREHFAAITYTGAQGSTNITGLKFEPDMIWIKSRTQLYNHYIFDSVRGIGNKHLIPNSNAAEGPSDSDATALGGTHASGFFVSSASGISDTYQAPNNYVAWCWKAGGAAVTNNDGNTTSQVSVTREAGFSIVTYAGTGQPRTIGHGLGKKPAWVMTKSRDDTDDWMVWHQNIHTSNIGNYSMPLNGASSRENASKYWYDQEPPSTVFYRGDYSSGDDMIAYCWTEIPGYSKFGNYTGNLNTNGPFVHLGFRPAWVMFARVDSGDNWIIKDSARNTINDVYFNLVANSNAVQFGSSGNNQTVDFLSNGFKIRGQDSGISSNGSDFVFFAFAEQSGISPYNTIRNAR